MEARVEADDSGDVDQNGDEDLDARRDVDEDVGAHLRDDGDLGGVRDVDDGPDSNEGGDARVDEHDNLADVDGDVGLHVELGCKFPTVSSGF